MGLLKNESMFRLVIQTILSGIVGVSMTYTLHLSDDNLNIGQLTNRLYDII